MDGPFHGFFFPALDMDRFRKIRRQHWQERLQIIKVAKFECDLLKNNENTAPQSREILQTFHGGGHKLAPHLSNVCKFSQLYIFPR